MTSRPRTRRAPPPRGFTILEVGIALLLLGLLMAVAVPSVNALSGAELRKTAGMLQGLCRDTYARAALSGKAHRIVFDLEEDTYWVEMAEGGVVMPRKKLEPTREGEAILDQLDERAADLDAEDEDDKAKLELYKPPSFTPVPFPGEQRLDEVRPAKLPTDVRIAKLWADHLERAATGGQVAVHFFRGGYAQEAHITLTDDLGDEQGGSTITLVTNPLTGEVYSYDEEPELPRDDEEDR